MTCPSLDFVTAPYAVSRISLVKLFFDDGLTPVDLLRHDREDRVATRLEVSSHCGLSPLCITREYHLNDRPVFLKGALAVHGLVARQELKPDQLSIQTCQHSDQRTIIGQFCDRSMELRVESRKSKPIIHSDGFGGRDSDWRELGL